VVESANKPYRPRVLIADDSVVSRHLLEVTLRKWGYDVESSSDGLAAWNRLQRPDAPALAILDWVMPGLTGPEVCRLVRQLHSDQYTYLILLTSKSLKEDLIEGMQAGADDYVTKPFDQHELEVRLRAGIRIIELQTALVAAREELRDQASRDSLTRLWNRSTIFELLDRELARMHREGHAVGLVMMDLDEFKSINDTYGHLVGDAVLREAARRLTTACRAYDSVGRYGGEEFLIILPGCDDLCMLTHSERLRTAISGEPMRIGGTDLRISASFGCTVAHASIHTTPEMLVRAADTALYTAKAEGKNCVRILQVDPGAIASGPSPTTAAAAPGTAADIQQLVGQLAKNR
jgi:diguanylate cyclase (GGDEF)-like protein